MKTSSTPKQTGERVAAALAGVWRASLPPLGLSERELESVLPQLIGCGAGALGWRRVRHSPLSRSPLADALRHSYRVQIIQSALFEREIERVLALLRAAGVEPILVKGWAAARLYGEPPLRPCGDMDLLVRPQQYEVARAALQTLGAGARVVDLHSSFTELEDRDVDELFARSRLVSLGATDVRVLCAEDHFGLLCIHLLRHGAWRPVWLCDVGAALEGRPRGFDWALCLGADRRRARWITCAVGLAHRLLGAKVEATPAADEAARLPRWLVASVLRRWESPYVTEQHPQKYRAAMSSYLRRPAGLPAALRERWPDPVAATVSVRGPFNTLPRWPFQLADCFARASQFVTEQTFSGRKTNT
ncbi:MAG: nucleotidyltransferase family protein [Pyrinomonadaceae bacterium]